jgi:integrase
MLENFLRARAAIERRNGGLLGPHLDSFVASLSQLGYARETVQKRLRFLYVFDRWLVRRGLALVDLQDAVVNNFLEEQRENRRLGYGDPQTARDFLDHLRVNGVVRSPEPVIDESPLATLGQQYENYLKKERGLSPITIAHHWQFARHFIVERFGDAPIRVRGLAPDDISRFLLRHAHSGSPAMAKMMVTALRYRAILLLLARLGLRAGEVIALELDDVDWSVGELKVRGKGGQHDRLPLPVDVGLAIANYIRHHRPHCTTRRLFVLSKAPYREFAHSTSLSSIVRRAIKRVGLHPPFKGAHVLRHSLATGMLRSGA